MDEALLLRLLRHHHLVHVDAEELKGPINAPRVLSGNCQFDLIETVAQGGASRAAPFVPGADALLCKPLPHAKPPPNGLRGDAEVLGDAAEAAHGAHLVPAGAVEGVHLAAAGCLGFGRHRGRLQPHVAVETFQLADFGVLKGCLPATSLSTSLLCRPKGRLSLQTAVGRHPQLQCPRLVWYRWVGGRSRLQRLSANARRLHLPPTDVSCWKSPAVESVAGDDTPLGRRPAKDKKRAVVGDIRSGTGHHQGAGHTFHCAQRTGDVADRLVGSLPVGVHAEEHRVEHGGRDRMVAVLLNQRRQRLALLLELLPVPLDWPRPVQVEAEEAKGASRPANGVPKNALHAVMQRPEGLMVVRADVHRLEPLPHRKPPAHRLGGDAKVLCWVGQAALGRHFAPPAPVKCVPQSAARVLLPVDGRRFQPVVPVPAVDLADFCRLQRELPAHSRPTGVSPAAKSQLPFPAAVGRQPGEQHPRSGRSLRSFLALFGAAKGFTVETPTGDAPPIGGRPDEDEEVGRLCGLPHLPLLLFGVRLQGRQWSVVPLRPLLLLLISPQKEVVLLCPLRRPLFVAQCYASLHCFVPFSLAVSSGFAVCFTVWR
ncbi:hypothetical protein TYRP_014641 [Tyrophagus putrescentiae]|nr:hypothetical protein TYRP_014641 [Tyrophagus putrescentiae]